MFEIRKTSSSKLDLKRLLYSCLVAKEGEYPVGSILRYLYFAPLDRLFRTMFFESDDGDCVLTKIIYSSYQLPENFE